MDFDFSPEQDDLRAAVRSTLTRELSAETFRELVAPRVPGVQVPDSLWRQFVDLGWTGILIPEAAGGLGLGLVDAVIVCEEMGRFPLPGPFLASAGFATRAAVLLGADDLLPGLADGSTLGALAVEESGTAGDPLAAVRTRASRAGDGWTLDGLKPVVLDGHVADWILVVARDDSGLATFLVESPVAEQVPGMDPTRSIARLELSATPARRVGPAGDQTGLLRRLLDDCAILLCAELIGACDAVFDKSGDYAKVRVQFGRPIGSFQAVKHIAAEMLQELTLGRVGVHYAAWTSDTEAADREIASAMAKSWVGEAAVKVTGDAIQIHGGVGFTWDVGIHLHYKRAKVNDLLLGRQGWQRGRVADLILGPAAVPA